MHFQNSKGKVYYGLHFCAGVAEYRPPNKEMFRVFLNEDTCRKMDETFPGCPVFVEHVDAVSKSIDLTRKEADGFVVESFFNKADGKHWTKFIVCSERGEKAIADGWKLSNCYVLKNATQGGEWNGVPYDQQILDASYEHLAIVKEPRYQESIILTPEQFKAYNEKKDLELSRLANTKEGAPMFEIFKRAKVENSKDYAETFVKLPKSKREVSIETLVNEADEAETKKGEPKIANAAMIVEIDAEKKMTVAELLEERKTLLANQKSEDEMCNEDDEGGEEDDEEKKKKKKKKEMEEAEEAEKAKNAADAAAADTKAKEEEKRAAKEKAERLANANRNPPKPQDDVLDPTSGVDLGKQRYGR